MSPARTLICQVGALTPSLEQHLREVCERNQLELRRELDTLAGESALLIGELAPSSRVVPSELLDALQQTSEAAALLFCNDQLLRPLVHLPGVPIQLARMPEGDSELESRLLACLAADDPSQHDTRPAQGLSVRASSWRGGWAGWSYSGEIARSARMVVPGEQGPERVVALVLSGSDGPDANARLSEFCAAPDDEGTQQRDDEAFVTLDRGTGCWSFARGKDAASPWLISLRRIPQSSQPLQQEAASNLSLPALSGDVVLVVQGQLEPPDLHTVIREALTVGGPAALDALHAALAGDEPDLAALVMEASA